MAYLASYYTQAHAMGGKPIHSQLSPFRRCMVKVVQCLSHDNVENMKYAAYAYLSRQEREAIKSGASLLGTFEDKCLLGPKDLVFLLDCLKEVGRWDLIFLIACNLDVESPPPTLPHTRSSFGNAAQCLMVKKCELRRAHGRYAEAMSKIADRSHYRPPWEDRFVEFFDNIVHGFDCSKQSVCDGRVTPEVVCLTLEAMSAYFARWSIVLLNFYQCHDARAISCDMSTCHRNLEQFDKALPAGWCDDLRGEVCRNREERQGYPIQELAQQAYIYLRDLAVEMIGNSILSSDPSFVDFSSNILYPIESISYTSAYLKISTAWIGTVLDLALTSSLACTELQPVLLSLIAQHRGSLDRNYHTLSEFVGSEFLDSIIGDLPVGEVAAAQLAVDPAMQASPTSVINYLMESVLLVVLVVLLKCSSAQVNVSSENIRIKLAKYLEQQRESVKTTTYFALVDRMHESVRDELDRFKVSKIDAFLDQLYPDCEDGEDRHDLCRLINQILS